MCLVTTCWSVEVYHYSVFLRDYSDERETTGARALDILVPDVQRVQKRRQAQLALH